VGDAALSVPPLTLVIFAQQAGPSHRKRPQTAKKSTAQAIFLLPSSAVSC